MDLNELLELTKEQGVQFFITYEQHLSAFRIRLFKPRTCLPTLIWEHIYSVDDVFLCPDFVFRNDIYEGLRLIREKELKETPKVRMENEQ